MGAKLQLIGGPEKDIPLLRFAREVVGADFLPDAGFLSRLKL